jgi:hypothetical protein
MKDILILLENGIEYVVLSFFIAFSAVLVSSSWRKNKGYFIAAILTGTVLGIVASQTPVIQDFDFLIAVVGTITGPATLSFLQHKSLFDVIDRLKEINEDSKKDN